MKRKWIVALIIIFPSLFWVILESSTINSKKLPIYGSKTLSKQGDSVFYKVPLNFNSLDSIKKLPNQGSFITVFIKEAYRKDSYRLDGLWEYFKYNYEKIKSIPFVFVYENISRANELNEFSAKPNMYFTQSSAFPTLHAAYYKNKPYYVDSSYFVLIDAASRIRGYYDARYIAEVKRLIEEYQHLRLKEEKQLLLESNEIIQKH